MEESGNGMNGHQSCWKGCVTSNNNNHVTVRPLEYIDLFGSFNRHRQKN